MVHNRLQLFPDGTFRWEVSIETNLDDFFGFDFSEEDFDEEDEAAVFVIVLLAELELGDGEIFTAFDGEWEIDGDELTLTGFITELLLDDQSADEFLIDAWTESLTGLADLAEELAAESDEELVIPEEEIEASLENLATEISDSFTELLEEEIVEFHTFEIDGDELIFDFDTVWDRVEIRTAVKAKSWGQVKRILR